MPTESATTTTNDSGPPEPEPPVATAEMIGPSGSPVGVVPEGATGTLPGELEWDPPGPGQWQCLVDHFPRSLTPEYQRLLKRTFVPYGDAIRDEIGLPTKGMAFEFVNGRPYMMPLPLVGKAGAGLPPAPLLKLAARLHPAFRACRRSAEAYLRDRPWREVISRWDSEVRPMWVDRLDALQAVDVTALADAALVVHLSEVRRAAEEGYTLHFRLHISDQTPIGLLLARADDWHIDRAEVVSLLAGCSPMSSGGGQRFDQLVRAAANATGGQPASMPTRGDLDELRQLGPDVAVALDAWLGERGWHLVTGYDIDSLALVELPRLIIDRVAKAVSVRSDNTDDAGVSAPEVEDRLRLQVPASERDEFDERLADARLCYALRDDNGAILGAWTMGLLRRAYLESGRRLVLSGRLEQRDHVLELTMEEVVAGVEGTSAVSCAEAARRAARRAHESSFPPPVRLGPPIDLPIAALPPAMALVGRAQLALLDSLGEISAEHPVAPDREAHLVGQLGIGTSITTGPVRVADDPAAALASFEPGEILITRATTPAWNAVLPLAAGLVTEVGGPLSHAAVIARELDLPAVVGADGAMAAFATGDRVRLDPGARSVERV